MPSKDLFEVGVPVKPRKTVMLTVSEACNLRCTYCYEESKPRRFMTLETAQNAIKRFMNLSDGLDFVEFQFFGGEPLLNFTVLKGVVDWFHTQNWNKGHIFFIGTNGTILTNEIKQWLINNRRCVFVGLSLDGNKEAHDINRSRSYDQVKANLPFFLEHWADQPMKMTIGAETLHLVAESVIDMEESGYFFTTNIVFEDIWGNEKNKRRLLAVYAEQLGKLVDYYAVHQDLFPISILDRKPEHIAYAVRNPEFTSSIDTDCVRYCGAGHEMVMVDVEGNEFPCHRFSTWVTVKPAPKIGELRANQQKEWKPEKCANCFLVNMCPTCAGFNWETNGDSGIRSTFHCEAFKLEVAASTKLAAIRLTNDQPRIMAENDLGKLHKCKQRIEGIKYVQENLDLSFLN